MAIRKAPSVIILMCYFLIVSFVIFAQEKPLVEKYKRFSFGSIKPSGWLKTQMEKDMAGFVGNLDMLVPDLIQDPICCKYRLF
jgi:uncharacterized protein